MRRMLLLALLLTAMFAVDAQRKKYNTTMPEGQNTDSAMQVLELINDAKKAGEKDTAYALVLLRQAVTEAKVLHNDFLQAKAFCAIGDIYFQQNLYNRALPNFSRAADLFYETGAQHEIAYAILGSAKSQYYRGNYSRAAENFVEVIKKSEQYNLPEIKSEAFEYLGLVYGAFQNFSRNTEAYLKSVALKQLAHDDRGIVRVAGNLSEIYYQLAKFDSSLLFADMAFQSAKKLNLPTEMYMAEFKKTASLIRLKKIKEAEGQLVFFQQDIHFRQDANLRIRYQTLLGNYYLAKKDENKSRVHYDSALDIIKRNAFPELLIIVYNDMAGSYYEAGDLKKAYDSYKKYNKQLSLFYTGDNVTKLANLEGLVMLDASKDEITSLGNENKLKALLLLHEQGLRKNLAWENLLKDSILKKEKILSDVLARENNYKQEKLDDEKKLSSAVTREFSLQHDKLANERQLRFTLLSGLGVVIALGGVIFFMYRRQRKKNNIIQKQANDLQTLMKEIHHRVKNNLQIISSLLDLQSLSIKDKQAAGAVREGKLRVQSMALIHQNLYNEGNIKGILIADYIKNLVENLFNSYNIQKNKIRLVTAIDHLNLDVDTVIPLGLIINELISNSLKYAFNETAQGEIFVALKENNKQLELQVKDNGCGFPPNWNKVQSNSFGYNLINAFAQKLKAKLDIYNDNGACITMVIARYKLA
jgi:two-component system, sensor histidine kinase PdtaS